MINNQKKPTMRESAAASSRGTQRPNLRLIQGGLSDKKPAKPSASDFLYGISAERHLFVICPACGETMLVDGNGDAPTLLDAYCAADDHIEEAH
jgi:hypothetical protein